MKKLEIEKTKPTFIISVLKVDIIKVGLVFSISNFFITKTPLANNWRRKKIPSCSYSALLKFNSFFTNFFEAEDQGQSIPNYSYNFFSLEINRLFTFVYSKNNDKNLFLQKKI